MSPHCYWRFATSGEARNVKDCGTLTAGQTAPATHFSAATIKSSARSCPVRRAATTPRGHRAAAVALSVRRSWGHPLERAVTNTSSGMPATPSHADVVLESLEMRAGVPTKCATTNATSWAMSDRSAPSLATILAMISVDPHWEGEVQPTSTAIAGCNPSFRECVSAATTACAPTKPIVTYSCDEAVPKASCSWNCAGLVPQGPWAGQ